MYTYRYIISKRHCILGLSLYWMQLILYHVYKPLYGRRTPLYPVIFFLMPGASNILLFMHRIISRVDIIVSCHFIMMSVAHTIILCINMIVSCTDIIESCDFIIMLGVHDNKLCKRTVILQTNFVLYWKNFIMFWANPIMSEQAPLYSGETVLCFPYLSLYLWKSSLYGATLLSLCACINVVMPSHHYILVKHCYVLGCHHYVLSKQHVIIMRWVAAIMSVANIIYYCQLNCIVAYFCHEIAR